MVSERPLFRVATVPAAPLTSISPKAVATLEILTRVIAAT